VVNRGGYSNPKVDELVDKAYSTASIKERDKHLQDATRILVQDVPMIPVHYEMDIYAVKDYVQMKPRVDKFLYVYDIDVNR
jgi:peptide/nickel transport system substrate-binding protein